MVSGSGIVNKVWTNPMLLLKDLILFLIAVTSFGAWLFNYLQKPYDIAQDCAMNTKAIEELEPMVRENDKNVSLIRQELGQINKSLSSIDKKMEFYLSHR